MDDLKLLIHNLIADIEENLTVYTKLTNESDKEKEKHKIEILLDRIDDEFSTFEKNLNKVKIGKQAYQNDFDFFEQKTNELKNNFTTLKSKDNQRFITEAEIPTSKGHKIADTMKSTDLQVKFFVGDTEISKGREKLDNIKRGLSRINEELTGIDEEIEYQHEKLNAVKDKISTSHSVVKQCKKVMGNISHMLYHDTLLKILIVLTIAAIIGIIVLTIIVKFKQYNHEKYDIDFNLFVKNINYKSIDEKTFLELFKTHDVVDEKVFFNKFKATTI